MQLQLSEFVKQSLLYRFVRGIWHIRQNPEFKRQRQKWRRRGNDRLLRDYLASSDRPRLQIGSGDGSIHGWLNSDCLPDSRGQFHLDATARFPIPTASFDLIYCEHMIEHIPYSAGLSMLSECCRILRPAGRIRIATPPLGFLIDMVTRPHDLHQRYIEFHMRSWSPDVPPTPIGIINDFVRNWGHIFIYDEPTLRASMQQAGFRDIESTAIGESTEPLLCNLEQLERVTPEFYEATTFVLEGVAG